MEVQLQQGCIDLEKKREGSLTEGLTLSLSKHGNSIHGRTLRPVK